MASTTRHGPRVRGTCPVGHVVETNAPYKRTTWRGACPGADGQPCGLHVECRRIPTTTAGPADPPAAPARDGGPIPKVGSYSAPDTEPGFDDPADEPPSGRPDSGDAGLQEPADTPAEERPAGPDSDDRGDPAPEPAGGGEPEPRRGWRERRAVRRAPDSEFDDGPEGWTAPGCYR